MKKILTCVLISCLPVVMQVTFAVAPYPIAFRLDDLTGGTWCEDAQVNTIKAFKTAGIPLTVGVIGAENSESYHNCDGLPKPDVYKIYPLKEADRLHEELTVCKPASVRVWKQLAEAYDANHDNLELANHTYWHLPYIWGKDDYAKKTILMTNKVIDKNVDKYFSNGYDRKITVLIPPYNKINAKTLNYALAGDNTWIVSAQCDHVPKSEYTDVPWHGAGQLSVCPIPAGRQHYKNGIIISLPATAVLGDSQWFASTSCQANNPNCFNLKNAEAWIQEGKDHSVPYALFMLHPMDLCYGNGGADYKRLLAILNGLKNARNADGTPKYKFGTVSQVAQWLGYSDDHNFIEKELIHFF